MKSLFPLGMFLSLFAAALLASCELFGGDNPKGTEVENELDGRLYFVDGTPAAGALVRILPYRHSPTGDTSGIGYLEVLTDSDGRYSFRNLTEGRYNVLGEKEGKSSFRDSVPIAKQSRITLSDTLDAPGNLTGFVSVEPDHLPTSVTVEVLGTLYYVNVDETGRFRLEGLAAGQYRVRVSTTLPEYTPVNASIRIRSGESDTLSDTLRMIFNGIPVVRGLEVAYDTAQGTARITWAPTGYPLLSDFAVYRDPVNSLELSNAPIGHSRDTFYLDPVFPVHSDQAAASGDTAAVKVEYRVKVRNKSDRYRPSFGHVLLEAQPPSWVRTFVDLSLPSLQGGAVSIGDTARVFLSYWNRTRSNDSLIWSVGSQSALRSRAVGLRKSGEDTLTLVAPTEPGLIPVRARIRDVAGTWWEDSISLGVSEDRPVVDAGKDTAVTVGSRVTLRGSARQAHGTVVKWEWDIGGSGEFARTSGPDTVFTVPVVKKPDLLCVLRATDDDGLSASDTIHLTVSASRLVPWSTGSPLSAMVTLDGKVYFFGNLSGGPQASVLDTSNMTSKKLTPFSRKRYWPAAAVLNGKIHVMGGQGDCCGETNWVDIYDPATDTWSEGKPMPKPGAGKSAAVLDGKIYVFQKDIQEYDPSTDTWTVLGPATGVSGLSRAFAVGGRIFIHNYKVNIENLLVFEPGQGVKVAAPMPTGACAAMEAYDGRLFAFGGRTDRELMAGSTTVQSGAVHEYIPESNVWEARLPLLQGQSPYFVAGFGNSFILLGSTCKGDDYYSGGEKCPQGEVYTLP